MIYSIAAIITGLLIGIVTTTALFQTEPPTDLVTFQWIVITALSGAVATIFWQYIKVRDNNLKELTEAQNKYYEAVSKNTEALRELKHVIADVASISRLDGRLINLEKRLEQRQRSRDSG